MVRTCCWSRNENIAALYCNFMILCFQSCSLAHLNNGVAEEVPGAFIHEQHTTGLDKGETDSSPPYICLQQYRLVEIKKKYQCNVCNKIYNLSSSLSNLKLIYTGLNKHQYKFLAILLLS